MKGFWGTVWSKTSSYRARSSGINLGTQECTAGKEQNIGCFAHILVLHTHLKSPILQRNSLFSISLILSMHITSGLSMQNKGLEPWNPVSRVMTWTRWSRQPWGDSWCEATLYQHKGEPLFTVTTISSSKTFSLFVLTFYFYIPWRIFLYVPNPIGTEFNPLLPLKSTTPLCSPPLWGCHHPPVPQMTSNFLCSTRHLNRLTQSNP